MLSLVIIMNPPQTQGHPQTFGELLFLVTLDF